MFDSNAILKLYASVICEDIIRSKIPERDIRKGVQDMANVYAADPQCLEKNIGNRKFTDFNSPAFRCAYLHKYAALHTYIVLDVMKKILNQEVLVFKTLLNSKFNLCCLGGGPGSDAVGVLAALYTAFNSFQSSITIIDSMEQWKYTFSLVFDHLKYSAGFRTSWTSLLNTVDWNFIGADLLLDNMPNSVINAISSASFITMVKFISAATCTNTEPMIEKIFQRMRPGALVLYIDNAVSIFTRLIERAGKKYNFKVIAGPYRHMEYSNEDLKIQRYGYTSCFSTKVTIILMQKPGVFRNSTQSLPSSNSYCQSNSASKIKKPMKNINQSPSEIHVNVNWPFSMPLISSNENLIQPSSRPVTSRSENRIQPSSRSATSRSENRIQPSSRHVTSRSENCRQPSSSSRVIKVKQKKNTYTRVASSPSSSVSVVSSQPIATSQNRVPYSEVRNDSEDTCCACCVIS